MTKEQLQQEYNITDDQFYGREKINGDLYLNSVRELPEGFNPIVDGNLHLDSVKKIPEGFNPTVGGGLSLDLVTKLPEGFNPTVGGFLDLSSLKELPNGFNPTVGGFLDLSSLKELPNGFNPTVGREIRYYMIEKSYTPSLGDDYIRHNNMLYKILSQKKNNKYRVVKVKQVGSNNGFHLIFDTNNNLIKQMSL